MKQKKLLINGIPSILWGDKSDKLYIHVHGKMSRKEYAESFAEIAESKGFQTLSFDLPEHGERQSQPDRCDIWNGMRDLKKIADWALAHYKNISLYGCSLGAYFSLQTYAALPFQKCLFQSPILDMEYLVRQMMLWFDITEEQLEKEKEIDNPVDPLRWDYFQFILSHPVKNWDIPTAVLYGGKDDLQSRAVMDAFCNAHNCALTVSDQSGHAFMDESDNAIIQNWLNENI